MRPSTLRDVSERVLSGADPVKACSEFLDHFYDRATRLEMAACLKDEPLLLEDKRLNALFAAAADYLSKRFRLGAIPSWVYGAARYLEEPWFTEPGEDIREYLTFLSPGEFRSRNIFTEAGPLRRARTWQAEQRFASTWETETPLLSAPHAGLE